MLEKPQFGNNSAHIPTYIYINIYLHHHHVSRENNLTRGLFLTSLHGRILNTHVSRNESSNQRTIALSTHVGTLASHVQLNQVLRVQTTPSKAYSIPDHGYPNHHHHHHTPTFCIAYVGIIYTNQGKYISWFTFCTRKNNPTQGLFD